TLGPREFRHRWPQLLPGGKAVLFTAVISEQESSIAVESLTDHRRKTLQREGSVARYLPDGHLVYLNHGALFAAPFDLDRLEVRGTPVPVLEGVDSSAG